MIQPSTERKQPRTRRWFSRTLLVLGGTAAATGTAWLVSTASANAAPAEPDLSIVEAVATGAQAGAGDLLAELTDLGDRVGLDRTGDAQLPPLTDLPDQLREIAARMGVAVPPMELPIVDRPSTGSPIGDEQDQIPPPTGPATAAAPEPSGPHITTIASPVPDQDRVLPSGHANDTNRRGPPAPVRDLPPRTAPVNAPAAPGSAGHDSPTCAEPPLADPSSRAVVATAERARDSRLPATPGAAPGTTPD